MWDIPGTITAITNTVSKFIPDANQRAQMEFELQKIALEQQQRQLEAQTEINKVEAQSSSLFVAGWRPAVGWVCVAGLAWKFILGPLGSYVATLCGSTVPLPQINTDELFQLLLGLLGMAGWRTLEKIKGVAR